VLVRDAAAEFQLVFFHARARLAAEAAADRAAAVVSGRVELFDGVAQMVHPDHILRPEEAETLPEFEPVYPLTAGSRSAGAEGGGRRAGAGARPARMDRPDAEGARGWPGWAAPLARRMRRRAAADLAAAPARERLAYDELLAHQLTLALARARAAAQAGAW
jgi:ATP-dependent DNA helicase RecG